jgi:two-component system, chemotaxis family, chemotaxis protein CheY
MSASAQKATRGWILIVDDDDDVRDALIAVLDMTGFSTVGARDGIEAIERIETRGRPGLVLLDLRMPRLNGADFLRWVRGDRSLDALPIIILSGDPATSNETPRLDVAGYLRKPVDLDELLEVVDHQLA